MGEVFLRDFGGSYLRQYLLRHKYTGKFLVIYFGICPFLGRSESLKGGFFISYVSSRKMETPNARSIFIFIYFFRILGIGEIIIVVDTIVNF